MLGQGRSDGSVVSKQTYPIAYEPTIREGLVSLTQIFDARGLRGLSRKGGPW